MIDKFILKFPQYPFADFVWNSSTPTQSFVRIKWVRVGIRECVSMPLSEIVASKLLPCPKCGSLVWLARIMPDDSECDQRTFECEDCGLQVTRIFESVP